MMKDDDWVKHALTDDSVVAELLSSLGRLEEPPPPKPLRLDWSVRQRRSRAAARHLSQGEENESKRKRKKKMKKAEPPRASPTTPLTWSGGATTSASGGSEESSKPSSAAGGVRSKVIVKNEAITSKRPRKKKTLAELRDDETILLKERKILRRKIEIICLSVQKQRATNESLKRLKLDLECRQKLETTVDSSVCSFLPTTSSLNALQQNLFATSLARKLKEVENQEAGFSLPDLNLPAEVDMDPSAAFYGIS